MSDPNNVTPVKMAITPDPSNPGTAALVGLLKQLLLAVGTLLAAHGVIGPNGTVTPERWDFIVGVIITLVPIIWQAWDKFRIAKTVSEKERIAVQATLNFAQVASDQGRSLPASVSKERAQVIIGNHS